MSFLVQRITCYADWGLMTGFLFTALTDHLRRHAFENPVPWGLAIAPSLGIDVTPGVASRAALSIGVVCQ